MLKTWHQVAATSAVVVFFLWTAIASIGFSWNHNERLLVEAELATTVAANKAFIAQLENDQKNAYELRQSFNEEVRKNEEWASRFKTFRDLSNDVLNKTSPEVVSAFIPWFQDQLAVRIRLVEQTNADLTDLVMDMSESVAEISGHQPPQTVEDVGAWLTNVAGDITEAYETQSKAMEVLHDTMTLTLSKGFATIDGTPLADPEFAGFSILRCRWARARGC